MIGPWPVNPFRPGGGLNPGGPGIFEIGPWCGMGDKGWVGGICIWELADLTRIDFGTAALDNCELGEIDLLVPGAT